MFDSNLGYQLVQIRNNKYHTHESYLKEFIYKFYSHNSRCCIKYIVSIKEYPQKLLTLDYYPKVKLTPKINSRDSIQDLRYRMLTKQNSFGNIGGTILDIMVDLRQRFDIHTWGFIAANLIYETSNENNKRYKTYKEILRRSFKDKYTVFGNKKNSAIFVVPIEREKEHIKIVKHYERIFAETN
ncbi:hypothetical protein PBAC_28470 [Pedobacter glucosidilyticus]|uniref:Uncharacterized protein n=1 Tax=Pedobacter aquae TaxID=2605747 RepID=A0A5C0VE79_9SPHI|nr:MULTISPECIES: hypothetical protein [Pedobacter]KHJ37002.1 hypothetical protein PBAC_28470 [Pedobacter glucosidilyticus]QEK50369.1 hypothetical protein FYC62_00805 [Pedobacter aquae]